jgi:hypothetical protein
MFAPDSPTLYLRWYHDALVKIQGNRRFPKENLPGMDQNWKRTVEASTGSKPAKFTAYSLLFTVPEAAEKHRDSCKPL